MLTSNDNSQEMIHFPFLHFSQGNKAKRNESKSMFSNICEDNRSQTSCMERDRYSSRTDTLHSPTLDDDVSCNELSTESTTIYQTMQRENSIHPPKSFKRFAGRWLDSEHATFIKYMELYGREWRKVAKHVPTRTTAQVRSHAQKYILKMKRTTNYRKSMNTTKVNGTIQLNQNAMKNDELMESNSPSNDDPESIAVALLCLGRSPVVPGDPNYDPKTSFDHPKAFQQPIHACPVSPTCSLEVQTAEQEMPISKSDNNTRAWKLVEQKDCSINNGFRQYKKQARAIQQCPITQTTNFHNSQNLGNVRRKNPNSDIVNKSCEYEQLQPLLNLIPANNLYYHSVVGNKIYIYGQHDHDITLKSSFKSDSSLDCDSKRLVEYVNHPDMNLTYRNETYNATKRHTTTDQTDFHLNRNPDQHFQVPSLNTFHTTESTKVGNGWEAARNLLSSGELLLDHSDEATRNQFANERRRLQGGQNDLRNNNNDDEMGSLLLRIEEKRLQLQQSHSFLVKCYDDSCDWSMPI